MKKKKKRKYIKRCGCQLDSDICYWHVMKFRGYKVGRIR